MDLFTSPHIYRIAPAVIRSNCSSARGQEAGGAGKGGNDLAYPRPAVHHGGWSPAALIFLQSEVSSLSNSLSSSGLWESGKLEQFSKVGDSILDALASSIESPSLFGSGRSPHGRAVGKTPGRVHTLSPLLEGTFGPVIRSPDFCRLFTCTP